MTAYKDTPNRTRPPLADHLDNMLKRRRKRKFLLFLWSSVLKSAGKSNKISPLELTRSGAPLARASCNSSRSNPAESAPARSTSDFVTLPPSRSMERTNGSSGVHREEKMASSENASPSSLTVISSDLDRAQTRVDLHGLLLKLLCTPVIQVGAGEDAKQSLVPSGTHRSRGPHCSQVLVVDGASMLKRGRAAAGRASNKARHLFLGTESS
mmetsp:Transcript_47965/g.114011  ORF Transcript_47965/g.114011 Transcript_47965/m.114011 type:complete len:211 (-) Transcript_47965:109-741(-)